MPANAVPWLVLLTIGQHVPAKNVEYMLSRCYVK